MLSINKKEAFLSVIKKSCIILLLCLIFSCQSDDDSTVPITDPLNGFWLSAEKGYILEFTEGKDILYNFNTVGCAIQDEDFMLKDFELFQVSENEIVATSALSDSEIKLTRLVAQNPLCLSDQIAINNNPKVNFDHFWNIFNDYYAFFEARNVNWSQYENLRDQVTTENFYDILEELVLLLQDGHVSIIDEDNNILIESGVPRILERLNANLSGDLLLEDTEDYVNLGNEKLITIVTNYLNGNFEIDERDNILWGLINEDIGYINIIGMEGYGTDFSNELSSLNDLLDTIMEDLEFSGVSKLIVDIRFNNGGIDTVALDIVSRFMDQERISYFKKARLGDSFTENNSFSVAPKGDFQFTEDIILLTSPASISAAELFALCMKDLPYVTIVGEHTAGAFSTILTHALPNGAEVGLSNEIYSDAQGEVFEIIGIGPETAENQIPFLSTIDFQEEKDSGIDRAMELLQN